MEPHTIISENMSFLTQDVSNNPTLVMLVVCAFIFDATLKAIACWRAARMAQVWWFVALFVVNSIGILPIVYIVMTRKKYKEQSGVAPVPTGPNPSV
jgi:hypothetical protein